MDRITARKILDQLRHPFVPEPPGPSLPFQQPPKPTHS